MQILAYGSIEFEGSNQSHISLLDWGICRKMSRVCGGVTTKSLEIAAPILETIFLRSYKRPPLEIVEILSMENGLDQQEFWPW